MEMTELKSSLLVARFGLTGYTKPASILRMQCRAASRHVMVPIVMFFIAHGVLLPATKALAEPADWGFFVQRGRAFEPLRADPREGRFRFGVLYGNDGFFEDLAWGGDLGLLEINFPGRGRLTIGGRGVVTGRFDITSESFDLMNTDFIGGLAAGLTMGAFSAELFFYHQSSHLGDELLERGDRDRIDLGFEEIRLLAGWNWRFLRLYGGAKVTAHGYPAELTGRTVIQAGAEVTFAPGNVPLYTALDVQGRIDDPLLRSACLQAGIGLGPADSERQLQYVFLELFTGRSAMGQFYADPEQHVLLGISYLFQ
jgi:hypothetical protein